MSKDDRTPPPGTAQNIASHAEDIAQDEDESGHHDAGTSGAERPAGTSSARASTSVDPQDPVDPQMPKFPTP